MIKIISSDWYETHRPLGHLVSEFESGWKMSRRWSWLKWTKAWVKNPRMVRINLAGVKVEKTFHPLWSYCFGIRLHRVDRVKQHFEFWSMDSHSSVDVSTPGHDLVFRAELGALGTPLHRARNVMGSCTSLMWACLKAFEADPLTQDARPDSGSPFSWRWITSQGDDRNSMPVDWTKNEAKWFYFLGGCWKKGFVWGQALAAPKGVLYGTQITPRHITPWCCWPRTS